MRWCLNLLTLFGFSFLRGLDVCQGIAGEWLEGLCSEIELVGLSRREVRIEY